MSNAAEFKRKFPNAETPLMTPSVFRTQRKIIPTLFCDFYKTHHFMMYPYGLEYLYSTQTPRSNKHAPMLDRVVVVGVQGFLLDLVTTFNEHFFSLPEDEAVQDYIDVMQATNTNIGNDGEHIRELHRYGRIPLRIKAIEEGTSVPIGVPVMTIENTDPHFAWFTNYVETIVNCSLWQPMVSASIARKYRQVLEQYAAQTATSGFDVSYQAHDFSMRGMSSLSTAETSGLGHLVYFKGTDTIPAITYAMNHYGVSGLIGTSIPATEHSIMSSYGTDDLPTFKRLMNIYKDSPLSVVSDTLDFWLNITDTLPKLKEQILSRPSNAPLVIRPDSGDPVKVVCGDPEADTEHERKGLIECLWDTFGGTVNDKGYKVLASQIRAVYGDSITLQRMTKILELLEAKGFSSENIVFGVGSYTYQYNTRDSLGFATKATSAIINGVENPIFKAPKADSTKRSQRGRVAVVYKDGDLVCIDGLNKEQADNYPNNMLQTVFDDGEFKQLTDLAAIRAIAMSEL